MLVRGSLLKVNDKQASATKLWQIDPEALEEGSKMPPSFWLLLSKLTLCSQLPGAGLALREYPSGGWSGY